MRRIVSMASMRVSMRDSMNVKVPLERRRHFSLSKSAGFAALFVLLLMTSCDRLFFEPAPRLNWHDDLAPVRSLEAMVVGDSKIRLVWDWVDLERKVRDTEQDLEVQYDKIVVAHKKNGYPGSRIGGTEFSIGDFNPSSNTLQRKTFSDLEYDNEHYFALYGHEKGGSWTSPLYTSTHMEDPYIKTSSPTLESVSSLDLTGDQISVTDNGPTPYWLESDSDIDENEYPDLVQVFIFNAEYHMRAVKSATLTFEYMGSSGKIEIYPMRYLPDDLSNFSPFEIWEDEYMLLADRTVKKVFKGTNGTAKIDVSDVVSRAFYHHTGALLFWPVKDSDGKDSDYQIDNKPSLSIEYNENW